ncbi:hypothetical protein [Micromonospora tarensis]|uniref:Uncharacterized protein n=1 Tax=Micromonospora tarensis TaxID=2806100 RepID=A0ABS1YCD0_9ACTN|nr:hypothetical protein [Micromonospora tarensis]MBM0275027.1 hypothetical protein [Micromonospora tarensis]
MQGRRLRRQRRLAQFGAGGSALAMLLVIGLAAGPLDLGANDAGQPPGGPNVGSPGGLVDTAEVRRLSVVSGRRSTTLAPVLRRRACQHASSPEARPVLANICVGEVSVSVSSSRTCRGPSRGRGRGSVAVVPVVLSALMLVNAGCHRSAPGVDPDERRTANAEQGGASLLLGAGDLGSDWRADDARTGPAPWPWEQDSCPNYRSSDYPAKSHRRAAVQRYYRPSDGSSPAHHVVETYEPGWAERNVEDVRQVLLRCASYLVKGSQVSFDVVDPHYLEGVGMLIRGRIEHADIPTTVTYFVVLKRGETVSTISLPDSGSQAAVDSIAAKAVARLG